MHADVVHNKNELEGHSVESIPHRTPNGSLNSVKPYPESNS